jgi:hypothetical protein
MKESGAGLYSTPFFLSQGVLSISALISDFI